MYTEIFLVSGHSGADFCGGKCQQLGSDSAELPPSSRERGGRTKKSGISWDWTIICSTALEPVLFAVGLFVMNLHSASWTYPSQIQMPKLFPPLISSLSLGVLLHRCLWPLCGLARLVAHCLQESQIQLLVNQFSTRITHKVFFHVGDHFSTDSEIINKYTCFRSKVWILTFPLFPLWLIPHYLWLKGQRPPSHPIHSHAALQRVGSISSYSSGKMYADITNGWT